MSTEPNRASSTQANELLSRAAVAAGRIEAGIALLADDKVLDAFRIANKDASIERLDFSRIAGRTALYEQDVANSVVVYVGDVQGLYLVIADARGRARLPDGPVVQAQTSRPASAQPGAL